MDEIVDNSISVINVFGFRVFSDKLDKVPFNERPKIINTISPNSYGISTKDFEFRKSLKESDYLVLDGVYFALAAIILKCKNIKKNQGLDVFYHFMSRLNAIGGKAFFIGSTSDTLNKIARKASVDYPNVKVQFFSPPYKAQFDFEDNYVMIHLINDFEPDIVFVGMTAPKQEKWAYQNKNKINAKLICCIGAVFDWYAGIEKPIKPIWWKLRLGWLIRTIHRPEIIKRYPNIGIFFWHLFLAVIGFKKYRNGDF